MARHSNGWIKIYRSAILGDIGSNYIRSGLFGALVAIANIKQSTVDWNGKPRKLERGELVTSLRELAELGEVDTKTVRKHLKYLKERETISIQSCTSGTFIKIINYEKYQAVGSDFESGVDDSVDNAMDNAMDNKALTAWTYNEELKNKRIKELKNNTSSLPTVVGSLKPPKQTISISSFKDFDLILNQKARQNYAELYPDIDFLKREFLKMHNWLIANPKKNLKSQSGWTRFVSTWLDKGWPQYQNSLPSNKADQSNVAASEVRDRINKLFGEVPHAS